MPKESDQAANKDQPLTIDRALQTIGGVLLAVIAGLSGWAWTRIEAHEGRIIRIETQFDSCSETLKEIKSDIKEIKQSLGKKP